MPDYKPFLKSHHLQLSCALNDRRYLISATTPDLRDNPRSCWGDWGPMVQVRLRPGQSIHMEYRSPVRRLTSSCVIHPQSICLNSPMSARVREDYPFALEFEDAERGLRFVAYLDCAARVHYTDVKLLQPGSDLDRLIFPKRDETATALPTAGQPAARAALG